ncbi:MAG: CopD family protein [Actinomycetota bacterium]|nr:CopD family protein [Actinomycetota bacterium]
MLNVSSASAHNTFSESTPGDGQMLSVAPTTWSIVFENSVPLNSASGVVTNGDGTRTTLSAPRHGATENVIVFDLPIGLSGEISTRWRLVGVDGHVISGRVKFSVQQDVQPQTSSSVPTIAPTFEPESEAQATSEEVRTALRFTNFTAMVLLGGLLFVEIFIAAGALFTQRGKLMALLSAGFLAIIPITQFFTFSSDINFEQKGMLAAAGEAIGLTAGGMHLIRAISGLLITLIVLSVLKSRQLEKFHLVLLGATSVMYLISLAYVGHSRSQALPWLGIPTDVFHTVSISVWLGGLIAIVFVVLPMVDPEQGLQSFSRFSYIAKRAVALIVVTGSIQSLRLHGNPVSLLSNSHGLLLLLKISLVGIMLRLAYGNERIVQRFQVSSSGSLTQSRNRLRRASITELLIGLIVILVTAILVNVTPG